MTPWLRPAQNAEADEVTRLGKLQRGYEEDLNAANERVAAQVTVVEEARARRDRAAQDAIDKIRTAGEDGLRHGWWENWGSKVVALVTTIAEWVSMVAQVGRLSRNASMSGIGRLFMHTLLRPGAVKAITRVKGFNFLTGRLGEEILGIASNALHKAVPVVGGLGKFRRPDVFWGLGRFRIVGDIKFAKSALPYSEACAQQLADLTQIASSRGLLGGGRVHIWRPNMYNIDFPVTSALGKPMYLDSRFVFHSLEEVLGRRLGGWLNAIGGGGQVAGEYAW
ncbi:hypothetical protein EII12_01905 [Buchananella hordeovulneris]|uniref:hypothetical protein n=1 Tax=Buchananella hordeovulneris TaxID=52770 RepID=UPI000F5E0AA3|nr:hypothetical protein [Buchananella hordeovulneris]RRD53408.1 hypothetical protein EII12_01905 [Buchananella hordeovulneris]